jgi:hypothetical protein
VAIVGTPPPKSGLIFNAIQLGTVTHENGKEIKTYTNLALWLWALWLKFNQTPHFSKAHKKPHTLSKRKLFLYLF